MIRIYQLLVFTAAIILVTPAAFGQFPTEFTGPPFPTFTLLTVPKTPPTDEYVISTLVTEPANIFSGIVGYDKYDFVPGFTSLKEFTEPRTVILSLIEGGFYRNNIRVFNHSTLNIDGGVITTAGAVTDFGRGSVVLDDSTFNLIRGTVRGILTLGQSHVDLSPGSIVQLSAGIAGTTHLDADGTNIGGIFPFSDASTGTIVGSLLRAISTSDAASVTVTQSLVELDASAERTSSLALTETNVMGLSAAHASHLSMSAGNVATNVQVSDNANLSLTGVSVGGNMTASGGSLTLHGVGMTGGSLTAQGTAKVFASGSLTARQISAFGQSEIHVENASVEGAVRADNQSQIHVSDSEVDTLFINDTAKINFNGGQIFGEVALSGGEATLMNLDRIGGPVLADEGSKLTISGTTNVTGDVIGVGGDIFLTGGFTQHVTGAGDSFISITDVLVRGVASANDTSLLVMHSGFVQQDLRSVGGSQVLLTGGTVQRNLVGLAGGTINMFGGHVAGKAYIDFASTFNFFGGSINGGIFSNVPPDGGEDDGFAGIGISSQLLGAASGGLDPLSGKIVATAGSIVNIYGTELSTLLVDPNYVDPDTGIVFSIYELVGILADGSPLAGQLLFLQNDTGTTYNLLPPPVPEPEAIVLAVLAGFGLIRTRRRCQVAQVVPTWA